MKKIGVLIYTYNRVDDTRINMEIIRNVWKKNNLLENIVIVHFFNGQKDWWPEKYLEDELLYLNNPSHFLGAEILIDEGMRVFREKYKEISHVIVLASDTWLVKPEYLSSVINTMIEKEKYLATCAWGNKRETDMFKIGMSVDFFIVNIKWATENNLFPLRLNEFVQKYQEIFDYQDINIFLERVFALRFKQSIKKAFSIPSENLIKKLAKEYIYRLSEREPVHYDRKKFFKKLNGIRTMYWPKIGLLTHHNPNEKQSAFKKWNIKSGEHGNKFIYSKDLSYYNNGLVKNLYKDCKKNITCID